MTPSSRNKFVRLHDDILRVGHAFTLRAHPGTTEIEVEDPWNRLRGVRSDLVRTLVRTNANNGKQYARIPTGGYIAQTVMRTARDDDVRRRLFMAMNSATKEQVEGMDKMLRLRAELGQLLGKSSYGQVYLEDKMAKDPEHVMKFLNALSTAHRPRANQEVQLLRNLKRLHSSPPLPASAPLPPLEAWDRQFYAQFLPQPPTDAVFPAMHMPLAHAGGSHRRPLLANPQTGVTLGTAISGLSRLLHLLYGIQLVPSDSKPGELWHPSVRRLDAVHDTQGRVGTIYCDLLSRPDGSRKYENPAHFTVQCSRRVDWDFEDPIVEPERGEEVGEREGREGRYKLPVVVLVANFRQGGKLSWVEVETVFHEMGHAVHCEQCDHLKAFQAIRQANPFSRSTFFPSDVGENGFPTRRRNPLPNGLCRSSLHTYGIPAPSHWHTRSHGPAHPTRPLGLSNPSSSRHFRPSIPLTFSSPTRLQLGHHFCANPNATRRDPARSGDSMASPIRTPVQLRVRLLHLPLVPPLGWSYFPEYVQRKDTGGDEREWREAEEGGACLGWRTGWMGELEQVGGVERGGGGGRSESG